MSTMLKTQPARTAASTLGWRQSWQSKRCCPSSFSPSAQATRAPPNCSHTRKQNYITRANTNTRRGQSTATAPAVSTYAQFPPFRHCNKSMANRTFTVVQYQRLLSIKSPGSLHNHYKMCNGQRWTSRMSIHPSSQVGLDSCELMLFSLQFHRPFRGRDLPRDDAEGRGKAHIRVSRWSNPTDF